MSFKDQRDSIAKSNFANQELLESARHWHDTSRRFHYQYMFEWLDRPIIQDPQDICAIQEIIWSIKPDLIIETGIAHGGSLVLSASILSALCMAEYLNNPIEIKTRQVVGVDIEIKEHNRLSIESHPLAKMITLIEGSSTDPKVIDAVSSIVKNHSAVLVILDSNHSADHVFSELIQYSKFVSHGSAIFVMDTGIEFAPPESFPTHRQWGPGNSPFTAVTRFLETSHGKDFVSDRSLEERFLITCAPRGLLRKG